MNTENEKSHNHHQKDSFRRKKIFPKENHKVKKKD